MKKFTRYTLFISYLSCSISSFFLVNLVILHYSLIDLLKDWIFLLSFFLYLLTIEEFYHWVKNGKRSEMSDFIAILFFFFLIFFFSKEILTSLMGAFSIYLWIGIFELKDYPIINKILIISLVTYNTIFIAGIFSYYLDNPFYLNTSFAFSFWIILILGFILFGRKYIVVWRFMSPEYLILLLYIIAWLAVVFINQYTPLQFISNKPLNLKELRLSDFFMNIYFILILVNWLIYFISGVILDKLLGIKKVDNSEILELVKNIKEDIGIKGNVKVGFGKYPILNAMAYGSTYDKRISIIAEDINQIPEDELKGIVAHELAHTKGKHTLILTFITSSDLLLRMVLGIPATFYDYTFGNPRIPMIAFIFLNLLIYIILFIFVRILEGKADLRTKESGYGHELVKALYNLESFYATGRDIGLNTMLLCEEKISKENQILDYMNTANYLYRSMIKPSKASLLSNFINSHPPSHYRIAAILSDELKPSKEAILPFICLKKSKQKKYAQKFENSRSLFKIIANEKFKEFFNIKDTSLLMETLGRKEIYKFDLNKDFIFKNKITDEIVIGKLNDIKFLDDICEIDQYVITNLKSNELNLLNSSLYSLIPIDLNEKYFFQHDNPLLLTDIEFKDDNKNGNYIFTDKNHSNVQKSILKTKLPNSILLIQNFKDQDVFLRSKGELKIYRCINIIEAENLEDFKISLSDSTKAENHYQEDLKYTLGELIIRPKKIYLTISKNVKYRKSEVRVIRWLMDNNIRVYIYLKKPVNNLEIGYIQQVNVALNNLIKTSIKNEEYNEDIISVKNIFGKDKRILYKTIESITFEYNSAMIQTKSSTSISSRLGYRILKKFKPERIIIT
ncbi:MAG: M48 family metalloprotease [Candidatus Hodarchaeota archaeon]